MFSNPCYIPLFRNFMFYGKLETRVLIESCTVNSCADFWHAYAKGHETIFWEHIVVKPLCPKGGQCQKMIVNMSINVHFRPTSGKTSTRTIFTKLFIAPKVLYWNFSRSLLSYFWAITFISAVIAILEPFGTLVPRISAAVKILKFKS